MSRKFGTAFQTAYVVDDLEPLLEHFTATLGIGPFFLLPLPIPFVWLEYGGVRTEQHDIFSEVALAYSGDMMIEVIVPGPAPSLYHEFLERGGRGVHHFGMMATDYDLHMATARAAGLRVVLEGVTSISRFAYLETDLNFPGTMMELFEPSPEVTAVFRSIKAASVDWDGTDPIRRL